MSALTVLYLVLPLPVVLLMHQAEEIALQRRWAEKNEERMRTELPQLGRWMLLPTRLGRRGMAIVALVELALVLLATGWVLAGGPWAKLLWAAVFVAFALNLMAHVVLAAELRGYVPGLVTAVLLLPWTVLGLHSIWLGLGGMDLLLCCLLGIVILVLCLRLAHRLSTRNDR